jgi:hypothetical protein
LLERSGTTFFNSSFSGSSFFLASFGVIGSTWLNLWQEIGLARVNR